MPHRSGGNARRLSAWPTGGAGRRAEPADEQVRDDARGQTGHDHLRQPELVESSVVRVTEASAGENVRNAGAFPGRRHRREPAW